MSPPCRVLIFQKLPYPRVHVHVMSVSVSVQHSKRPYVLDDETLPCMHIFGEVGDKVGASKTRSWGIFFVSIWIGLDKIFSLCALS